MWTDGQTGIQFSFSTQLPSVGLAQAHPNYYEGAGLLCHNRRTQAFECYEDYV